MKDVRVKLEPELHKKLASTLAKRGERITDVLREILISYCDDTGALRDTVR